MARMWARRLVALGAAVFVMMFGMGAGVVAEEICFPVIGCLEVIEPITGDASFTQLELGDLEFVSLAGAGAFGSAYRAMDVTGKVYVIKAIKKDNPIKYAAGLRDVYFGELLASDGGADLLHVQRYVSSFEDDWLLYVAFEDEGVPEFFAFPARHLFKQLMHGLHALHKRGVYHRDLKPGNFVVNATGHLRIIDFGSAVDRHSAGSLYGPTGPRRRGEVDVHYAAPEILRAPVTFDLAEGEKFDMFAAGVTLLDVATGSRCGLSTLFPASHPMMRVWRLGGCSRATDADADARQDESLNDLTSKLLAEDPRSRLTAAQVLKHPYLAEPEVVRDEL